MSDSERELQAGAALPPDEGSSRAAEEGAVPQSVPPAGTYVQQAPAHAVGGVGMGGRGAPLHRRVSMASEKTPLFLGDQSGEGNVKPLCVRCCAPLRG